MTPIRLSERARTLEPSATLAMSARAKAMARQGVDVVSFGAGEPDFDTPEPIRRAAIEAIERGLTRYVPTLGLPEVRAAIAEKLRSENGLRGVTGDHVAVTAGAKQAVYLALQALLDPPTADGPCECLLPVPAWVSYAPMIRLAGGVVRPIETDASAGFRVTPQALRDAITPRTRVLILNTPSNPCGTMYARPDLEALGRVIDETASVAPHLTVITDEIYEKIVYGNEPHVSPGSIPSLAARTVTVNGLSKAYAMTGWRLGYLACPGDGGQDLIAAVGRLADQMTGNVTTFAQAAIPVALRECADEVERMRRSFAARAALVRDLLGAIPGLGLVPPVATFYAFPDVGAYLGTVSPAGRRIETDGDLAEALLEEARVAVVPGSAFGRPGHIRISFACSEERIREGLGRLGAFLESLAGS